MKIRSKPIEQLEEEAEKDMELRLDRTEVDSVNTPRIFNKYHKEKRLVRTEIINCEAKMKKLYGRKWFYYMGKAHPDVYEKNPLDHKIMKADVKIVIEADDEMIKLRTHIALLEMKKEYINEKLVQINNRNWQINNAIKSMKFKNGENS